MNDGGEREFNSLAARERYRDDYWVRRDPIYPDRLLWRAQSFRHLVHLLPGQTILELGAGLGLFTSVLDQVAKGKNPITAVTLNTRRAVAGGLSASVERIEMTSLPGELEGRRFDYVVVMDLLDHRNCSWFARLTHELLAPGGQVLFYESNPWNVMLKLRRMISRWSSQSDSRRLLGRVALYELMSEVGFIRVFTVYNDFVYSPLPASAIWILRNLSILLENLPGIQTLSGSILIHAQKPPRAIKLPVRSLFEHEQLRGAVSVVVPCHNEEANVEPLVRGLNAYYCEYLREIILVDDNSTDDTAAVIRRLAEGDSKVKGVFRRPPNGVGRAIADGYKAATGRYVLSMDCDFQHLLPEFQDLFDRAATGVDVVIGSRFSRHSVLLNYPFRKIVANRGFHVLAQLLLRKRFRDVTNNLKLMRKEVVARLDLQEPGFAVNAETGLQPFVMGFSVAEVPISWINREAGMGSSSFHLAKAGGGYWRVLWRLFAHPKGAVLPRLAK